MVAGIEKLLSPISEQRFARSRANTLTALHHLDRSGLCPNLSFVRARSAGMGSAPTLTGPSCLQSSRPDGMVAVCRDSSIPKDDDNQSDQETDAV